MPTKQSKDKLVKLVSRAGLWNEAIGFCFLAIATFIAIGFATGSKSGGFFSIGLIANFTVLFIVLYAAVGLGFVLSGYYLHRIRGKYIKPALVTSTVLSILTVINIIPIITAYLSIYVLTHLEAIPSPKQTSKQRKPFDLRDYPALSVMGLLTLTICVSLVIGINNSLQTVVSTRNTTSQPPVPKVSCTTPPQPATGCMITATNDGFKAIFPSKPTLLSFGRVQTGSDYEVIDRNDGYSLVTPLAGYEVQVEYFANDNLSTTDRNNLRLGFGQEDSGKCNQTTPTKVSDTPTTYNGYIADKSEFTGTWLNFATVKDQPCDSIVLVFLKGDAAYTIRTTNVSQAEFNAFLNNFELLN